MPTKGEIAVRDFTEKKKRLEPGEKFFGVFLTLLGIVGYATAMTFSSGPYYAPDMFPKIISGFLIICGVTQVCFNFRRPKNELNFRDSLSELIPKDVAVMTVMLVVYGFILPEIHFIAASFLFILAGTFYLGNMKKIIACAIISAIATACLVAIFQYIFMVVLP